MVFRILNQEESDKVSFKSELTSSPQLLVCDEKNIYFDEVKKYAEKFSSDIHHMVASIIVADNGEILGMGTNSSHFHDNEGCKRKDETGKPLYKSGEGYEVCPGCNPETSHSELLAIRNTFLFKILEIVKDKKEIQEKYVNIINELNNGISLTNLVSKIAYEEFINFTKYILGEDDFLKIYEEIEEKLKNSTLYMFGHYWACETCWNNCKNHGIKNIIVQKEAFSLHR